MISLGHERISRRRGVILGAAMAVAVVTMATGCAGNPPPQREQPSQQARWNARGVELLRQGDATGAREHFQRALVESRAVDDLLSEAEALRNLGRVDEREGDREAGRQRYAEALGLYQELDRAAGADLCLGDLALLDILDGRLDDAERRLQAAERSQTARDDRRGLAVTWNHQGLIRLRRDDPAGAHALFGKALAALRELDRPDDLAATLANRGESALRQQRWDEALAAFEESLTLARSRDDREGIALSLRSLAALAEKRGDLREAVTLCRRALRVNEAIGATGRAEADRRSISRLERALEAETSERSPR